MSDHAGDNGLERLARVLGLDLGPHVHRTSVEIDGIRTQLEHEAIEYLAADGCTCPAMIVVRVHECARYPTTLNVDHQVWCVLWHGKLIDAEVAPLDIARTN